MKRTFTNKIRHWSKSLLILSATISTANMVYGQMANEFPGIFAGGASFEGFSSSREIIEKRGRNVKHFKNLDGTFTAVTGGIYHYQAADGSWQDIDLSIKPNNLFKGYSLANETNEFKSYFPQAPGNDPVRMLLSDGTAFTWWKNPTLSFTLNNKNLHSEKGRAQNIVMATGSSVHYPEVYEGITEEFVMLRNGIENNTIFSHLPDQVKSLPSGAMVTFTQFIPLKAGWKVEAGNAAQSGDFTADHFHIAIPGTEGIYFGKIVTYDKSLSKEEALYLSSAPLSKLSEKEKAILRDDVLVGTYHISFRDGGILVSSAIAADWLKQSGRNFPVIVDPTVTITPPSPTGSFYTPTSNWWGYQRHANLYLASEIGVSGVNITAIEYNRTNTSGTNASKPYKVFMKMTTATTLTSAAWNSTTYTGGLTPVFDASVDFHGTTTGWKMFTLSSPFFYGGDNLMIMVYDAYGGSGSAKYLNTSSSVSSRQAYRRADGTDPGDGSTLTVENYLPEIRITYEFSVDCSTITVDAGTISTPSAICPGIPFVVPATGGSSASGLSRVWQQRVPSGTGTWTTIAGATGSSYSSPGITDATDYRCIVTCTASGDSDTTNVHTVSVNPITDCYCIPAPTSVDGTGIINVNFNSGAINNTTGSEPGNYGNYTAISFSEYQSITVPFTVTYGNTLTYNSKIWIDWNNDGIFTDAAPELVAQGTSPGGTPNQFSGSFTIPLTATPGPHRVRVGGADIAIPTPCYSGSWASFEDYTLNVLILPGCETLSPSAYPATAEVTASPEIICISGDVDLNMITPMPAATGFTYQWQQSSGPTGPWTNIGGALTTPPYTATGISTNTYFRCRVLCDGSAVMTSDSIYIQTVTPETPTVFSGQTCGPGEVELTGTVSSGDIFWYDAPVDGTLIGVGDTILTPSITTTTTFYAAGGAFPEQEIQVGTGTSSSPGGFGGTGPFNIYYRRNNTQMMYTAAQIAAAGGVPGVINEIMFNCTGLPTYALPDYTVSIKAVPATMTTLVWQTTGFTDIFTSTSYMPAATGWQSFPIAGGFPWDGTSNIVIKVCNSQVMPTWASTGTHEYTSTSGQMLWYGNDDPGSACPLTGTNSSTYLPNVIFNFDGCTSARVPVQAYVRDTPTIDIPIEDGVYCVFNNEFSIPTTPEQPDTNVFLWNTGGTDSFITVGPTSGVPYQYWVEVKNEWGCAASDTVNLTLNPSPVVELGPDTLVCEGGVVTLDAGSTGTAYYWNTGATTRTIDVDDGGKYYVLVTNEFGCMATDTIDVTVDGYFPYLDGIVVDNLSPYTFKFTPHHPQYVVSYSWDFGDGTASSTDESPTHTYAAPGTYLVTLTVSSTCGTIAYTSYAVIFTGIDENDISKYIQVYPNPSSHMLQIESSDGIRMDRLSVVNALGQVLRSEDLKGVEKYSLDVSAYANGMYYLKIDSRDGAMIKKFQVMK